MFCFHLNSWPANATAQRRIPRRNKWVCRLLRHPLNERLTSYIKELEQGNDDLERARRVLAACLEDFEVNYISKSNVSLDNEIREKEELECLVRRLKKEARDLRHESIVSQNSPDSSKEKQLVIKGVLLDPRFRFIFSENRYNLTL